VPVEDDLEDEEDVDTETDRSVKSDEGGDLVRELYIRVRGLADFEVLRASDSKYALLVQRLREYTSDNPEAKIVLFSSFRATLGYLEQRLGEDGIRTMLMTGDTSDKDVVIEEFKARPEATVLLSSEVGSEGVDLQFSRVVVNYDLPWNPMRVEQRIGRLDRLGQEADSILIWNLYCAETIDQRIYERLYRRIGVFERALGGLEPILGSEVQRLTRELMKDELTPRQEAARIDATALAIETKGKLELELEENAAHLFALGDYLLEQVHAARDLGRRISDLDLRNYVVEFLRRVDPASKVSATGTDPCECSIRLGVATKTGLEAFMQKHRVTVRTRLISGDTGGVLCRFRNMTSETEHGRVETINQFHPLVRYARDRLREEESDLQLAIAAEVAAEGVLDGVARGRYVFAVERWLVSGVQVSERLAYDARNLDTGEWLDPEGAERLVSVAASHGQDWLSAAADVDTKRVAASDAIGCMQALTRRFEDHERLVTLQNHDRADTLLRSLERQMVGQEARLEETIRRLLERGKDSLVPATRGRIERLRERTEMRRHKIQRSAEVSTERSLFLMGIVRVS
jgi:hypothetical protein